MAWRDSLLECKFRGVVLDVLGTREAYARSVSVAEYPYQDGGETEDLGARPVQFALRVIFFGDDYEDRLRDALAAFNTAGPGELIHPIWGSIEKAQVLHFDITHDAPEPDACTVSVEFIESAPKHPFFEKSGPAQVAAEVGAAGDEAVDHSVDAVADIVGAVKERSPFAVLDDLRQSMLGPLLSLTAQVQGVVISGLDIISYPRAWARDIASLSNGLLSIAAFPANLLQEWRAVTGVFKNIGAQWGYGTKSGSPASGYAWPAATPWRTGTAPTEAQAQAVVRSYLAVNNAAAQADAAAKVLATEAGTPTLTPMEIEMVVASARAEIESAIEAVRAALPLEKSRAITEPLKTQALAIQAAGQAIIESRPPLVRRALEAPGNLRLIAHRWYGDHTRAPELLRLNSLRNPNGLQMGDVLNASAR